MLDAMGIEDNSSPFPDNDPFDAMIDASPFDSFSWSGMGTMSNLGISPWSGMMPGIGGSPWTGMVPGIGGSPWSGMMPGSGSLPWSQMTPGMPGSMSPWSYANPDQWSRYMPRGTEKRYSNTNPDSPTRAIDGRWAGPDGDRLWIRDGWIRVYRDVHSDARVLTRGGYLYIGIPETKQVMRYEYGLRGRYLGLRDDAGNVQIFKRVR